MICCGAPNTSNDNFSTFSDACYSANLERMRDVLRKNGRRAERLINELSTDGYTPLHRAAQRGNIDVLSFLLEHRADPCILSKQGESALHLAAFHRKGGAIRELLQTPLRSLIDQQDQIHSMTALHLAIYRGAPQIAENLLKAGASPYLKDKYGNNAIDLAQFWAQQTKAGLYSAPGRHEKTIEILKQYVENIEGTPSTNLTEGSTPIAVGASPSLPSASVNTTSV